MSHDTIGDVHSALAQQGGTITLRSCGRWVEATWRRRGGYSLSVQSTTIEGALGELVRILTDRKPKP